MRYGNVITNVGAGSLPGGQVGDIWWPELPWEHAHAAGWRIVDETVEAPAADPGYTVRRVGYDQSALDPDYCVPVWEQVAIPEAYPAPDVTIPMMDSDGNQIGTARLIADAELNLVAVIDTASPQRPVGEQIAAFRERAAASRAERRALRSAARRTVADVDALTPDEAAELAAIFEAWRADEAVTIGTVREYQGALYKAIQAHTTQADWTPPATPALWVRVAAPGAGPQPWVQPYGGSGTYVNGAQVTHGGGIWRNDVAAPTLNVWEPGVYGWTRIGDA